MKRLIVLSSFSLILTAFLLLMNCAKEQAGSPPTGGDGSDYGFDPSNPSSSYGYDPTTRGVAQFSSTPRPKGSTEECPLCKSSQVLELEEEHGTSAPITITNRAAFEDFRLGVPINSMEDIEDLRVYVKLSKTGKNYYGGIVTILYWDYDRDPGGTSPRGARLSSGGGNDARYNVWFKKSGKNYYHGFFQENAGSVILVIDKETPVVKDPDNPTANKLYSGSIWNMQFRMTFRGQNSCNSDQIYVEHYIKAQSNFCSGKGNAPPPPFNPLTDCQGDNNFEPLSARNKRCWEFDTGPFDCRTWRSGSGVATFKAINPNGNCYTKMGTFQGLDILKAFNVSKIGDIRVHTP